MKAYAARLVWLVILVGSRLHVGAGCRRSWSPNENFGLEHAWNQAEALNDLKALDSIFDNRLVYIDS